MTAPVLEARDLWKSFDGVEAVRGVSLEVDSGEVVALIGPNGAGKTTLFNLVNGQIPPDRGSVHFTGIPITHLPPRDIARKGVARTFQVAATFASMTVRENIEVALLAHAGRIESLMGRASGSKRAEADALLSRVGIADLADAHCAALAYGDAKRVELALALAGAPRLLLMDEPTAGMAPRERSQLMTLVSELANRDRIAVLFTEHDMDVVFAHADRVIVLERGKLIAAGPPATIRADARVQAVYLGEAGSAPIRMEVDGEVSPPGGASLGE